MKKWCYILLLFPMLAFGQFDFESRYFTMDDNSLSEPPSLFSEDFKLVASSSSFQKKTLRDFVRVTVDNYYQPVAMTEALYEDSNIISHKAIDIPVLQQKEFGFSFSVNGSNSFDGTSNGTVRNTVYKEMRPAYFCQRSGLNLVTGSN